MALINHERRLPNGTLIGGEPSTEQLKSLVESGFTSMISLRAHGESQHSVADYAKQGVTLIHLPISGPNDFTEAFLKQFDAALGASDQPIVIFCATGNRVGAALSLHGFRYRNLSAEAAIELGQRAGLTRLEGFVRQWLSQETDPASR